MSQAELDALIVSGNMSANRIPGAGTPADVVFLTGMTFTEPPAGSFGPQIHGFYDSVDVSDVFDSKFAYQQYNPISESHSITFEDGIGSFGFKIFDAGDGRCFVTCAPSTFQVTTVDVDGNELSTTAITPGLSGVSFFGIDGEGTLIGKVRVDETAGYFDNEYFGDYVTGQTAAPVPLPAGLTLLLGGLLGLGGLRRFARS